MQIRKPAYYDSFQCIAGSCPDSCCKEWEVQVDPMAAAQYRGLTGPLGQRLRQVLREENGETVMTIENGRCPMWDSDGLCRIQRELGEAALCKVCSEFPRLTHDYGDFKELGLELSCPEAARWILREEREAWLVENTPESAQPEYDTEAMALLKASRKQILAILSDTSHPVEETLAVALLYGCQVQSDLDSGNLDSGEWDASDWEAALEEARALAAPGDGEAFLQFFRELELLTPQWWTMLNCPNPASWEKRHLSLARYAVNRYWLQAVADYDLYSRVKLILIACLLVRQLGGDLLRTSQLFSKEIENNSENVDAILDGAYSEAAFRDDRLLGMLLSV